MWAYFLDDMKKWAGVGFLFLILFPALHVSAQFNHPELKWKVIETDHFLIHYHQGEEEFAFKTARIAENIYNKLTLQIGYRPKRKIPVVIENYDDKTGGYTSILTGKIVIQAQSDPVQTSGDLSWIEEVLGHEMVHYISFSAMDESIFPLRKAMANLTLPMWFIEGLAQYLGEEWHSLKEMVVADRAREDKVMSEGDLGAFYFFDGWERRSGYYQSDSFIRYIFDTYGREKIYKVFDDLKNQPFLKVVGVVDLTGGGALYPVPGVIDFDQSLKNVLGKDSLELYREWREWLIEKYKKRGEDTLLKEPAILWGKRAQCPVFSPRGDYLAFVSNKGYDFAIFDLYLMSLSTGKIERLTTGVNPYLSFSPDGRFIVYSKTEFYPPKRSFISDLYQIEVSTRNIKRLTYGERASHPVFSPSGDKILFVKRGGGNSNLYLLHLQTGKTTPLTLDKDGLTQNFAPSFSPDGETVVFVRSEEGKRNLYLMRIKDKKILPLTRDEADERCPVFSPDGKMVIFISDKSSEKEGERAFNLWSFELETGQMKRHTLVKGGIFDPAISADGEKIAFSAYKGGVFFIYIFPYQKILSQQFPFEGKKEKPLPSGGEKKAIAQITQEEKPPQMRVYPYRPKITLHYIFPWFSISDEETFFSVESYASDPLEKHQLICRAYLSRNTQYEVLYINRSFEPTIWIDLYHQEGWSEFGGEDFPVKVSGQAVQIYYPLNDKILLQTGYSQEDLDSSLFDSELNLYPWKGSIRKIEAGINYFNLLPVRESDILPSGSKVYIGGEWADKMLGSEIDYLILQANLKKYLRLSPRAGFALQLHYKKVENKLSEPRIVFSLKEWKDLRGYPQNFLDSMAGENLLLGRAEYRFNLKRRLGGSSSLYFDTVGGALFFDAGTTWREGKSLQEVKIYKDAGVELRLRVLPFGKYSLTMRLGIAWPFDYEDRGGRFFIGLGGIF